MDEVNDPMTQDGQSTALSSASGPPALPAIAAPPADADAAAQGNGEPLTNDTQQLEQGTLQPVYRKPLWQKLA